MLEIILYIGISQFVFAALLVFTKKRLMVPDKLLGIWLLLMVLFMGMTLAKTVDPDSFWGELQLFPFFFTIGPFMYLYVRGLAAEKSQLAFIDGLHLLPFAIFSTAAVMPSHTVDEDFLSGDLFNLNMLVYSISAIASFGYYLVASFLILKRHQERILDHFSYQSRKISLNWVKLVNILISSTLALTVVVALINFFKGEQLINPGIPLFLGFTLFGYGVSFFGVRQPAIFIKGSKEKDERFETDMVPTEEEANESLGEENEKKYERSGLQEAQAHAYIDQLKAYMQEQKPYLKRDLTIQDVADDLDIPQHHLTETLNQYLGNLFTRGFEEQGKIFSVKLGPRRGVVMVGPEYATTFFKETDKPLDLPSAYNFIRDAVGNVGFVSAYEDYLNHLPVQMTPFTREKMVTYIATMEKEVQKWLDNLPEEGSMDIQAEMVNIAKYIAGACICGPNFNEEMGQEFWDLFDTFAAGMNPILPPKLPFPQNLRRNRAGRKIHRLLKPALAARRKHPERYNDTWTDLIFTNFKDGTSPTDEQILGMTLGLLFAGHETTAGQAAWMLIRLLQNPDYLEQVKDEINSIAPYKQPLDAKTLISLRKLRWAVDETTRLHPSADVLIRTTMEDIEIGEYRIPKNWWVFTAVGTTGRMDEIFTSPDQFDPKRFAPGRAEHKIARNSINGFGGGKHKCTGMNLAINEMLIITKMLFQQFEVTLETKDPQVVYDTLGARPESTWVSFKRKPQQELITQEVKEAAIAAGCPHMQKMVHSAQAH